MSLETSRASFPSPGAEPSRELAAPVVPRLGLLALSAALALAGLWGLTSAILAPAPLPLPLDRESAAASAAWRQSAQWAAWLGVLRGDLYARAAFAGGEAAFLEKPASSDPEAAARIARTRANALSAVSLAPINGAVWLLLAELPAGPDRKVEDAERANAVLTSYFTAPNDPRLASARLQRALALAPGANGDLIEFIKADLRQVLGDGAPAKAALAAALKTAPQASKDAFLAAIAEIDPNFARQLRGEPAR
ncbi:hypothetical protein [Methylocella sp.]|uniref:hypothetical protein n=1 Tax=Methylocella sp. TaxID=1978226 RepID=UPI003784B013